MNCCSEKKSFGNKSPVCCGKKWEIGTLNFSIKNLLKDEGITLFTDYGIIMANGVRVMYCSLGSY